MIGVNQWVSKIVNVESKSNENLQHLQSVLGPIRKDVSSYEVSVDNNVSNDSESEIDRTADEEASVLSAYDGYFTHEIVFRIEERMFIESVTIYEKVCTHSSLMRIDVLNQDVSEPQWVTIWKTDQPLSSVKRPTAFVPNIEPTLFRTDTLKFIISGSLILIDGIGIAKFDFFFLQNQSSKL